MKKLLFILLSITITTMSGFAQISSNGSGGGNWNNTSTWAGGTIPGSGDDVTIIAADQVIVNTTQSCEDMIIDTEGLLTIKSGANLSSSQHLEVNGTLTQTAGILNVGNGVSDYFEINGGILNFSGGTINVAGRYKQLSAGDAYLSGSSIMNISTAGVQTTGITSFSVTTSGEFSVTSGSTAQIILINGNSGSTIDLYYSPSTSNFLGGSLVIENASSESDIFIDSDEPIYKIESKVGLGNTFHFDSNCDFNLSNFTITSGTVQVDADSKINITSTAILGADDNLTLASGASVIFAAAPTEKIIVQRTLTNSAWHYISSPVNDTRTFTLNTSLNLVSGDFFYRFDETLNDGTWVQIYPSGGSGAMTEQFTAGQGYAMEYNNGENTISFNGTIRTGDVIYDLSKTGSLSNNGYNLTGNPYQATIIANNDANSLLNENLSRLDATNAALYFWDQSSSDYSALNNTDTKTRIAVGQGFMVRAKNNGETFTYKESMQENGTNTFYKSIEQDNWVRTRFRLSNGQNLINDILIGFNDGMTNGLDISYDAGKFKGNPNIALYSYLVDESQDDAFATQALPSFLEEPVSVKLGFDLSDGGDFTFSIKDIEYVLDSLEIENTSIELEDTYLDVIIDLISDDYNFHVNNAGTFEDRFVLHFNRNLLGIEDSFETINNEFLIYANNNKNIIIKNIDNNTNESLNIKIIDLRGRLLYEDQIKLNYGESHITKPINTNGIILVTLTNTYQISTRKIVLN